MLDHDDVAVPVRNVADPRERGGELVPGDAHRHTTDVRSMVQAAASDLDDDGKAQGVAGPFRAVGAVDDLPPRVGQAETGVGNEDRLDPDDVRRWCVLVGGRRPGVGPSCQQLQRRDRSLRGRQCRDPQGGERVDGRGWEGVLRGKESEHERQRRFRARAAQPLYQLVRFVSQAAHHPDHGVEVGKGPHRPQGVRHPRRVVARDVERVREVGGGQLASRARAGGRGRCRHGQGARHTDLVGGEPSRGSGAGDDTDAPAGRPGEQVAAHEHVAQLLKVLHLAQPGAPEHRAGDVRRADHAPGVSPGREPARVGPGHPQEVDRLAGALDQVGHRLEPVRVGDALDEHPDGLDLGAGQQSGNHLEAADVQFVASRHQVGDAGAALEHRGQQPVAHAAALRDKRDTARPGREVLQET